MWAADAIRKRGLQQEPYIQGSLGSRRISFSILHFSILAFIGFYIHIHQAGSRLKSLAWLYAFSMEGMVAAKSQTVFA